MIKNIQLEFFKIKHRKIYITIISVMFVSFLWALWAQTYKNTDSPEQEWMTLFYNIATLNCVVMPVLVAITASKLVDIEHKGNTLKLLKTLENSSSLFNSKFITGSLLMLLISLLQSGYMIVLAVINKYSVFPFRYFIYFMLYTLLINVTLFLLQMILSFQFVNQMIALVIAIGGSFLGLFSLFFGGITSKLIFWGYYGSLSPVGMDWEPSTRVCTYHWASFPYGSLLLVIIICLILYVSGQKLLRLKEE